MNHSNPPLARRKRSSTLNQAGVTDIFPASRLPLYCPDQSIGEAAPHQPTLADASSCAFLPHKHALRAKVAMQMIGVRRSKFYLLAKADPSFPRSFRLGNSAGAATVWWAHELQAWLEARAAMSRKH